MRLIVLQSVDVKSCILVRVNYNAILPLKHREVATPPFMAMPWQTAKIGRPLNIPCRG